MYEILVNFYAKAQNDRNARTVHGGPQGASNQNGACIHIDESY